MEPKVGHLYTLNGPDHLDAPASEIVNVYVAGVGAFERGTPVILTRIGTDKYNGTFRSFNELEEGKYFVLIDGKEGWVFSHELRPMEDA